MSLFKKAQSAVAHNSKIPALGNSDLKKLQELIHTEKSYVNANTKAANEIQNAADCLRVWSNGEGDDLEDVLPKVALLYEHLARAQTRYNYYVSTMRLHLKSIREREEKFSELKARRRTLTSKIENMERKLAKMGPENKDLAKVTSSLRELRSDMDVLNNELAHEDAALGDYKRGTIAEALSLKSGGLMELAEKAIVIAESCRLLVEEIPLAPTAPGMARAPYRSEARTNRLLQEAVRQLESIHFEPRESQMNVDQTVASPTSPSVSQMPRTDAAWGAGAAGMGTMGSHDMDDHMHGSQGWVASADQGLDTMQDDARYGAPVGLPTVHEGVDDQYEGEEPSRRYTSEPRGSGAAGMHAVQPETASLGPSDMYDEMPQRQLAEAPAPPPGMYAPDVSLHHMSDVVPAYPPMPPSVTSAPMPQVMETPNDERLQNRAYFEEVGGTKALQAAAARSGGFPVMDNYSTHNNHTPGMFTMDEGGRSMSPSALRPIGPGMNMPSEPMPKPAYTHPSTSAAAQPEMVASSSSAPSMPMAPSMPVAPVAPSVPKQPPLLAETAQPQQPQPPQPPQQPPSYLAQTAYPETEQAQPPAYLAATSTAAMPSAERAAPPVQVGGYLPYVKEGPF